MLTMLALGGVAAQLQLAATHRAADADDARSGGNLHICSLLQHHERLMLMMLALHTSQHPERLMLLMLDLLAATDRAADAHDARPGRGGCASAAADDARRAADADDARHGRQCTFEACSNIQSG